MRRRAMRLLGAAAFIAAACWCYGISIAKSAACHNATQVCTSEPAMPG